MRAELRLFFLALQFLTRLPLPRAVAQAAFDPRSLNQAARHFALVGAIVGAAGAIVALLAVRLWPPVVAATLALAFTVWLTAAFHEDGLADTFDALLGAAPREKALAIMKDSRIGSYGAAVLVLSLLLRVLLLAELLRLQPWLAAAALVVAHTAGRACAVLLMASLPYAGDEAHAKAKPLARSVRAADAAWALLTAVAMFTLACAACHGFGAFDTFGGSASDARLLALALAWAAALALLVALMRAWLRRRLAGFTGDTLGACEQLAEIVSLLVFAAVFSA
jgi:adenosylcobinamide-GDP ribazoletransferase